MRFSKVASAASAIAFSALVAAEAESDVVSLTSTTFTDAVDPEPLILVEFFAPWCGHCKALAPHYEEAATALKEHGVKLAKVDCVDQADLCQAHGVQGYPTLKVFKNGSDSPYTGPRKADGIVSYMIKQSLPAVSDVTAEKHDEFKTADKVVVVAYLPSTTGAPAPEFSKAAEKHRDDYLFGISTDPAVAEANGIHPPALVLYRSFDEPKVGYPYPAAHVTVDKIEDWINEYKIPTLDEVSGENYATYAESGLPLAYLFVDPADEKKNDYLDIVRPVATNYRGKVNFVWIDATKFADHAKALNLAEPKWPAFVIQDLSKQFKYPYDQSKDIRQTKIDEMVEDFLAGNLTPELKSQPIPETQDESVYTLVSKEFEQVVFDDSKDVFVEFYATWCGHCKRLKPIWDSLGDHFESVKDSVVIAKMEATENDIPPSVPFRISSFPTLKFKPAGSKEFLDYDGDRSLESLIAFVEESAKNKFDIPPVKTETETETKEAPEPEVVPPAGGEQVVLEGHDEL
ncbi:disulfide isomerase, partial [Coniophora puteana RWD-64-598 SS2]